MGLFNKKEEEPANSIQMTDALLEAFLQEDTVSRKMAMNVPTFAGCINTISNTVSSVPIYLYKRQEDGSSVKVENDKRVDLINEDTGDTFTGSDLKKQIVKDYYTNKGGYIYINRKREIKSLHYVDPDYITFQYSEDPIFKEYRIICNAR